MDASLEFFRKRDCKINDPEFTEFATKNHNDYYRQFVSDQTIQFVINSIGLQRILDSRDPHLNDIPLQVWDDLCHYSGFSFLPVAKLKEAGEVHIKTLGVGVCVLKQAAKMIREQVEQKTNQVRKEIGIS
jgi:hypothetical protein